jgi:hypothetical protein
MKKTSLSQLQASVQDKSAFCQIADYHKLTKCFLSFLGTSKLTRIVSPSQSNYIFYQYGAVVGHRITRPLNADLYVESEADFSAMFSQFMGLLQDIKRNREAVLSSKGCQQLIKANVIGKIVYTMQQSIGSIGDSFDNPNQSRKRIGQLFENLVKLIIQELGLHCEPRTINIPIPGYDGYIMSYQLDLVFSRNKVVIATEDQYIRPSEIVGSVKTTSKDRIDKVFLDKYLLTKLLGREIPVIAVFLHDVQRAQRGDSIFGINSTFKTNHFLGYTVALKKLDGVYYVDPRPEMVADQRLREHINDFQQFLLTDLWSLSGA